MILHVQQHESQCIITIEGRIDPHTCPILHEKTQTLDYDAIQELIFDFRDVVYVSAAGLRELLVIRKRMGPEKIVKIIHASEAVYQAVRSAGLDHLLDMTRLPQTEQPRHRYQSFHELLQEKMDRCPNATFLVADRRYTWRDIEQTAQIIAKDLQRLGVYKGSHVALCGANSPNWIMTFFAIQKLGAVAMLINYDLKAKEIIQLAQIGDITHFCMGDMPAVSQREAFADELAGPNSHIRWVYDMSSQVDFSKRYGEYEGLVGQFQEKMEADDASVVIFSSGTTGKPKGVLLSAYNVLNAAAATAENTHLTARDRNCQILPLFHIFGFTGCLFACAIAGAEIHIPKNMRTETILSLIQREQCTVLHSVPTMMLALVHSKEFTSEKVASVRCSLLGGAAATEAQVILLRKHFPNNHFMAAYGLTELAIATESDYEDTLEHVATTIGKPLANIQVSVRDMTTGRECKRDGSETGEILLKGFNMMVCYYKLELDRQDFNDEGWLCTGDLGYIDQEGYIHLVGRKKEIIIRGGENIIPSEIASAISEHEAIADVKVLGLPDAFYGEIVGAAILLKNGAAFEEEEMRAFLEPRLAKYKIPAHFVVYDAFPSFSTGKINMLELKKDMIEKTGAKA